MADAPVLARARLTISTSALRANFRLLREVAATADVAAVVKADGYGLGVDTVAETFAAEGCTQFFVATAEEGLELRRLLRDARIYVFAGVPPGTADDLAGAGLVPVLNSLEQIDRWSARAVTFGDPVPAALHLDTGMSRLGLETEELDILLGEPDRLRGVELELVMSHLACADDPDDAMSARQLERFTAARQRLPLGIASLANSAGIFLGSDYHLDLVRPGIALYGGRPQLSGDNPMAVVATLEAPIVQVRTIAAGDTVGYGATHTATATTRIATVAAGYGDGYLRAASNRGSAVIDAYTVPIVGRVSMDLLTLDVTAVPASLVYPGAPVELIGARRHLDDVAADAGTLAYEILTDLGDRYEVLVVD